MAVRENTRLKIIEVATRLFGHYGFYKTSMDEIARTARKAKGSLYYHFASKEELFTAVVAGETNNLKKALAVIVEDEDLCADEKIKSYLIERMTILNSSKNYHETLKADFYEHFDFIDHLRTDFDSWEKEQLKLMIHQGMHEHIFDHNYGSLEALLDVLIMVLKGLEIPFFLQGKYEDYAPHFDDLIKILIKGLGR